MALYPDTTSFYSARIVGGPIVEKGKVRTPSRFDDVGM